MSAYHDYRLHEWNRHLFEHYFVRRTPDAPAVTSLLVTPEELARAVDAPESEAMGVHDSFVACVRSEMDGRLFPAEFGYYATWADEGRSIQGEWKSTIPNVVARLLFACLAATESPEDFADENSYIARLDALCDRKRTEDDLRIMPALWRYLSEWLGQADDTIYRALILPPDNGWTRIGYTVRLAFPSRRDQRALVDVLHSSDCMGDEPPVGPVLLAVGNAKDRFRKRFQEVFLDFRMRYQRDDFPGNPREHLFWAAVQNAARRGYAVHGERDRGAGIQLLAEADEAQFVPFLVAEEEPASELGFQADALPTNIGLFGWLLSSSPTEGVEASIEYAVLEVLRRTKRFRRLDRAVQQGVLLFADSDAGAFELVSDAGTREVRHALVQKNLAAEFAHHFSTENTTVVPEAVQGWHALLDVSVSPAVPGELDGTVLERVWSIQRGIPVTRIKVVGGVRIEGSWLGSREALPRIRTHGDGGLWLRREDGTEQALTKVADGLWALPSTDVEGPLELVQREADRIIDKIRVEFIAVPSFEHFKAPTNPETWLREAIGHDSTLVDRSPLWTDEQADWGLIADHVTLLGRNVGQFVTDPRQAAWQVVRFGNRELLRRGVVRDEDALPRGQVVADGLRRRWRKLLCNSNPDPTDRDVVAARSVVRQVALYDRLPHIEPESEGDVFTPGPRIAPAPVVERVVAVLVARLNSRVGISLRDWYELLGTTYGIEDRRTLRSISRGWEEAGLIDVASYTRWRSFVVYGKMPALAVFRCGSGWAATLTGLTLASTVREIRKLANERAIAHEERGGCSEHVPAALCLRASTQQSLADLAREAKIACVPMSMCAIEELARDGRSRAASPPPVNYLERRPAHIWDTTLGATPNIEMYRWYRRDAPEPVNGFETPGGMSLLSYVL